MHVPILDLRFRIELKNYKRVQSKKFCIAIYLFKNDLKDKIYSISLGNG